jgi:hypothetical protein
MATAALVTPVVEPEVTLTMTKREAAMLTLLSGYVVSADAAGQELYELLQTAGREYGLYYYLDAHELGLRLAGSPEITIHIPEEEAE